ncbi:Hypothetical Protein PANA_0885 [Pantoea ananatis LMG 20103]|uniref:Uncharacterized protein n=1 Tax=Pantoea ananatis (strain LMG 20103) TaxID=706191 RepID=D4GL06_PANAM|nr:Hypothetical Protein PANA_0885 [Pantoea ananatis LMG 20103]
MRFVNILQGRILTRHSGYLRLDEKLFKKRKTGSDAFFNRFAVNFTGGRVVLDGQSGGVKKGNFRLVLSARFIAQQDFTYLSMNRVFTDDVSVQRVPGFPFLRALGQGIDNDFCPAENLRIELLLAALVGADGDDMGAGLDPTGFDQRPFASGGGNDNIGLLHRRLTALSHNHRNAKRAFNILFKGNTGCWRSAPRMNLLICITLTMALICILA